MHTSAAWPRKDKNYTQFMPALTLGLDPFA
jgi:hypothetical protein